MIAESSCQPGDDVQAVLITYAGRLNVTNAPQQYMDYLERGGQLITSRQTSHEIYNALFGADVSRPPLRRGGQCQGNIQNVRQSSPDDGFWVDTPFIPISANLTGCGYAINNLPDVTLLAGWNENEASLGYLDVGAGRIWFVESNWFEQRDTFTELSFYMMESMILGSGSGGLPPCLDGIDNDGDGAIDLFDSGCTGREDPIEDDADEDTECADGLDNDSDGIIDYPFDTGCLAAGDLSEASPDVVPQCANGLDVDIVGKPDYPNDPGCSSRADDVETDEERRARCRMGGTMMPMGSSIFPPTPDAQRLLTKMKKTQRFGLPALTGAMTIGMALQIGLLTQAAHRRPMMMKVTKPPHHHVSMGLTMMAMDSWISRLTQAVCQPEIR